MNHTSFRPLLALALATGLAAPAAAAEPVFLTPAAQPLVFTNAYVIPYAISAPTPGVPSIQPYLAETVITVGANTNGNGCRVQIEWRDFDGTLAGVSGPFPLAPDQTLEFTTHKTPPGVWPWGTLNVFRNTFGPFEGHAKVRSSCGSGARLRVNAQVIALNAAKGTSQAIHVKVTKVPGNVGD